MVMHRRLHKSSLSFIALVCTLMLLGVTTASAVGQTLHHGQLDINELHWEQGIEGSVPHWGQVPLVQQVDAPQLPGISVTLLIPANYQVGDIEVVPLKTQRMKAPGNLATGRLLMSSEDIATGQNLFTVKSGNFPERWGFAGGTSHSRGFQLLSLTLFPVKAIRSGNGAWSEIEILEEYEIRLLPSVNATGHRDRVVRQRLVPGERARMEKKLAEVIANPEALIGYARADGEIISSAPTDKTPHLGQSPVSNLIITSEAMAPTFQVLADHRTDGGLPSAVVTVQWIKDNYRHGADLQETIRGFIREAYERWGVEYVLLAGDTDVIPARYATSTFYPPGGHTEIPADMYYACLDGNWNADGDNIFGEPAVGPENFVDDVDMASDVYLGRAPVSSPLAAANFVTKVMDDEKEPAGSQWPNRRLLAAEVLFWTEAGAISLDGAMFAEDLATSVVEPFSGFETTRMYESFDLVDEFSQPVYPGAVQETRTTVIDSLNAGNYGIFGQIGHGFFFNMSMGDANMSVSDADNLSNVGNPFLMYALNCASCAFDYSCLMERFLQNDLGGSVASIGASRAAFPYTSNDFQYEFFRLMFEDGVVRVGDVIEQSKLPWLSLAYSNSFTRWTYFNYTLLGDPAMTLWTDVPANVDVALPASVGGGNQAVSVTVTSGGSPVAGANVTLQGDGTYATAVTDVSGQVSLDAVVTTTSSLQVDVMGSNSSWETLPLAVVLPSSYIALDSMNVIDDGSDGSIGNGNGVAEAGETIALWPTFAETAGTGSVSAVATLASSAAGVVVSDGTAAVPAISGGGQAVSSDPFLVSLANTIADGTSLIFDLSVNDGAKALFASEWDLMAQAPEVEPVELAWFDTFYGNSDGILDNGERVAVVINLKNYGAGVSDQITGRLRTNSPNVVLNDTVVSYTSLSLLAETQGTGLFSLSVADTALEYDARVEFTDNYGRTFTHEFLIGQPGIPDNLEANSALGPDVIAVSWTPVTGSPLRGYHVYRSDDVAGPYDRVTLDLIEGIAYYRDAGLAPLTQYYYRITALDSSLVESAVSITIAQSTAPAEVGDFPLPFETESSGHCAVGDVTGDGHNEIVFGADEIYVWRADGSEIVDGDSDAQTLGPITNEDGVFSPAGIALAELDGMPGLEIIAHERDTKTIHVYHADGTELPGWPQSTHWSWAWATPAVGDVDGDGDLEIVVNNLAGETLVWHHDGTELADGDSDGGTNGVFFVRPEGRWSWGLSAPALFDLDGDGAAEIIFGTKYGWNNENRLHAIKYDGTEASGFPINAHLGGSITCSPTIADLDDDSIWEIIFASARDSLYVVEQDGSAYPGFPIPFDVNTGSTACPSPAVGDFNLDGNLEIVAVETSNSTTAQIHVIDTSGNDLPGWPQFIPGNSESSPVVGDINGDGHPDIIHGIGGGDEDTPNNLYAFAHDGSSVDGFPITLSGPIRPAAVLTDLDMDGDVDIVYGGWDLNMHAWDMPYTVDGTAMPWATFRGHSTRDGVHRRVSITEVEGVPQPSDLSLLPNHPNPFNPQTTVRLFVPGDVKTSSRLNVEVYDVQGRMVRRLYVGDIEPGWHDFIWNGRDDSGRAQASGVYLLRVQGMDQVRSTKMSLVR